MSPEFLPITPFRKTVSISDICELWRPDPLFLIFNEQGNRSKIKFGDRPEFDFESVPLPYLQHTLPNISDICELWRPDPLCSTYISTTYINSFTLNTKDPQNTIAFLKASYRPLTLIFTFLYPFLV